MDTNQKRGWSCCLRRVEVDFVEVRLEVETTLGLEALVTLGEGLSAGRVGDGKSGPAEVAGIYYCEV